jgi:hypothetical protein
VSRAQLSAAFLAFTISLVATHVGSGAAVGRAGDQTEQPSGEAAVKEGTTTGFIDTPLKDALEFLSDLHHVPIVLDEQALAEAGVAVDEPINLTLSGITLASALNLILAPLGLDWIEDEVLKITTNAAAAKSLELRTYDVTPLVTPDLTDRALLETITSTIDPNSWTTRHGNAAAHAMNNLPNALMHAPRHILVVLQTRRNHERIADLLTQLATQETP